MLRILVLRDECGPGYVKRSKFRGTATGSHFVKEDLESSDLLNPFVMSKLLYCGAGARPELSTGEPKVFNGAVFSLYRSTPKFEGNG